MRSGAIDCVVVDSVAALLPKSELEGEMGDSSVGVVARLKDSCVSVDDGQSKSYGVKGAKEKPLHQFEITIQFKEHVCK